MKYQLILSMTAVCMMLTGCAHQNTESLVSVPETSATVAETQPVTEMQAVTEMQNIPETQNLPETLPAEPSSPDAVTGIWKNQDSGDYLWFRDDNSYIVLNYAGIFPDDIAIERTEDTLTLTIGGNLHTLTPVGAHWFDTIDGLYDVAEQNYQIFIAGNMVFLYTDAGISYQYNGELLTVTGQEAASCIISGDTMQYLQQTFIRNHDLDDFLLHNQED